MEEYKNLVDGQKNENKSEKFLGWAQDGNEWKGLRQLLISLTGNVIGGGQRLRQRHRGQWACVVTEAREKHFRGKERKKSLRKMGKKKLSQDNWSGLFYY